MHIQFNCILVIHLQYIHKKGTVINKLKLTHSNVKSDCRSAPVKPSCLLNVHLWQKKKQNKNRGMNNPSTTAKSLGFQSSR